VMGVKRFVVQVVGIVMGREGHRVVTDDGDQVVT